MSKPRPGPDITSEPEFFPLQALQTMGRATNPVSLFLSTGGGGVAHNLQGTVSPETENKLRAAIAKGLKDDPSLAHLSVQLGHTDLVGTARNLLNLPVSPLSKALRAIPAALLAVASKAMGGSHYDPMSHSVRIFSDAPAVGLHELGHAKDFKGSDLRALLHAATTMSPSPPYENPLVNALPYISLHNEAVASRGAAQELAPEDREQIGSILMPAYGSYVGGAVGSLIAAIQAARGKPVTPALLVSPMAGMAAGGLIGAAYNKMKGYSSTQGILRDAARAGLLAAATYPTMKGIEAVSGAVQSALGGK